MALRKKSALRTMREPAKDEELLMFGYQCNVFRDDEKALFIDQGKHLIPWNGDDAIMIDRYAPSLQDRTIFYSFYRTLSLSSFSIVFFLIWSKSEATACLHLKLRVFKWRSAGHIRPAKGCEILVRTINITGIAYGRNFLFCSYDVRAYLSDLSEYDADVMRRRHEPLTEKERHLEALLDEERYLELRTDVTEKMMYEGK